MRRLPHEPRKLAPPMDEPGAFQCFLLRALQLPQTHRDVFLLKEIQGHSVAEIAAILGITIETALLRLKRAGREIGYGNHSEFAERGQ